MKKILVVFFIYWSCVKNEELTPVTQTIPPAVVSDIQELFSAFSSKVYPTYGAIKVVADKTCAKKNTFFSRILKPMPVLICMFT